MTRILVGLALLLSLGNVGLAQQAEPGPERGPRFFVAMAGGRRVPVDVTRAPVLATRLTLDLDGVTRKQALAQIARKAGLMLVYGDAALRLDEPVRLHADGITVAAALTDVLWDAGLDVVFSGNRQAALVRRPKGAPLPQAGMLVGRVTDATTGHAIAGADVRVVGTQLAAAADDSGRYVLRDVPAGAQRVMARRIGYQAETQAVTVSDGGTATLDFALTVVATRLDELVTTVTGEQRRGAIANAIARIQADSTVATAPVRDLAELVAGRAAGVQVMFPNGVVGQAPRLRVRGTNSMSLSNDPLVIVDGARVDHTPASRAGVFLVGGTTILEGVGGLASLNPEEIETIDIVKGPSAATLYGTDAANGVIVVTTKRGREGPARWTLYTEQGLAEPFAEYPDNYFSWGRSTTTGAVQQCILSALAAGQCVQDSVTTFNPLRDSPSSPLGTGRRQQYGAQVSGGTQQVRYFLSGEYEHEVGYLRLSDHEQQFLTIQRAGAAIPEEQIHPNALEKLSLRANTSMAIGSTAEVTVSAGLVRDETRLPNGSSLLTLAASGRGTADTLTQWTAGQRPGYSFAHTNVEDLTRAMGSVAGSWRARSWLTSRATVGLDFTNDNNRYLVRRGESPTSAPDGRRVDLVTRLGLLSVDLGTTATVSLTPALSSRTAVGAQYNRRATRLTAVQAAGLLPGAETVAGAATVTGSESTVETVVAGGYAEQQFGWRERVFVTGALRFDGASSFGQDFRTAVYPKASISWLPIDPMSGTQPLGLNSLRLRAAYGSSGVQPGPTAALARDTVFTGLAGGVQSSGAAISSIGNPALRPERQTEIELGLDAEAARGRVRLELTLYNHQSANAIVGRPIAATLGLGLRPVQQVNVGEVRNRGIEGLVNVRVLDGRALSWELGLNGSLNQNRLLTLAPDVPVVNASGSTFRHVPGYPLNGIWDRPLLGFTDANGNGIIEEVELAVGDTAVFLGAMHPTRQLTATTGLGLFGDRVRLNALFDYRGGHARFHAIDSNRCLRVLATCRDVNDRTAPLDRQAAAVARNRAAGAVSSGYVEDGSFVRWRELSLAFSGQPVARLFRARAAWLTFAARNLATWSGYSGPDVEAQSIVGTDLPFDNPTPPPARYFIARLTLSY